MKIARIYPVVYDDVRHTIQNGDIALCRPSSWEGEFITHATDTAYSHATMLGWAKPDTLMVGETREHHDARLIDARSEFFRYPGAYDVFSVRVTHPAIPESREIEVFPDYDGDAAWAFVCHAAGSKYGWNHISRVNLRRVCGAFFVPPIPNSDDPRWCRDCSALDHAALRLHGGPTVRPYDCDVIPGDLADPRYFRYRFTIFATRDQVAQFQSSQLAAVHEVY